MQALRSSSLAQPGVLAAQPAGLERPADDDQQLVHVERLLDEVVGALLHRRDRDLDIAVTRDDDDRDAGVVALDRLQDLDPVHAAALQPDVEDDEIGRRLLHRREGAVCVVRRPRRVTLVPQQVRDEVADVRLVVDDQDVCHVRPPPLPCPGWMPRPGPSPDVCRQSPCRARAATFGSRTETRAPSMPSAPPASPSTSLPPCCSTIFLTMARPKPGALGPRRHVRVGQPVAPLARQADAVVLDRQPQRARALLQRHRDARRRVALLGAAVPSGALDARHRRRRRRSAGGWSAPGRSARDRQRPAAAGPAATAHRRCRRARPAAAAPPRAPAPRGRASAGTRLGHPGELGELVDHAADLGGLAGDDVEVLLQALAVRAELAAELAPQPIGRELDRASAGS